MAARKPTNPTAQGLQWGISPTLSSLPARCEATQHVFEANCSVKVYIL